MKKLETTEMNIHRSRLRILWTKHINEKDLSETETKRTLVMGGILMKKGLKNLILTWRQEDQKVKSCNVR